MVLFLESPNVTRTGGRAIDVVVIHTIEIAERADSAESAARWFAQASAQVSAHYTVDADSVVQCVRDQDIAWHARGGNRASIGIELAGRAAQSAREWDDPYSRAVLRRAAGLAAEICARYAIPVRRIRAPGLVKGLRGITGHLDVSRAFGQSDHWDPGPAFPWRRFLAAVRSAERSAARGDVVERALQA